MMKKVIGFLMLFFTIALMYSFNEPAKEKINWISMSKLNELYAQSPKPILIDVYTTWCGWCKEMDRTTYKNKKLTTYVNEYYYAVKMDAESSAQIVFNKKSYTTSDLATYLLMGDMSFPTTVFLPTIDAKPAPLAGYLNAADMEAPLKFFGEGAHQQQTFVEFNKKMKKEWR